MRKVLNWGVVPLNLKWQGMVFHGLCWAMMNSPENIRRFNSRGWRIRMPVLLQIVEREGWVWDDRHDDDDDVCGRLCRLVQGGADCHVQGN